MSSGCPRCGETLDSYGYDAAGLALFKCHSCGWHFSRACTCEEWIKSRNKKPKNDVKIEAFRGGEK